MNSTFWISWEVLNPSKKWHTGASDLIAIKCAKEAKSATSCTECEQSIVMPVCLIAYISWWSPKIESDLVASDLADTCKTAGKHSPTHL